jgi:hypothetical protein
MDQQNPAYQHHGVTMPQEMYAGYATYSSYLATVPISSLESLTKTCDADDGAFSIDPNLQPTASSSDCQVNLQNLLITPQNVLGPGGPFRKGDKTWLVSYATCVVVLEYDMNWDLGCIVSWAEIAATVQMILETCEVQQGGLIGGRRQLRNDGKCGGTVFVGGHTVTRSGNMGSLSSQSGCPEHFMTGLGDYGASRCMDRALASSEVLGNFGVYSLARQI